MLRRGKTRLTMKMLERVVEAWLRTEVKNRCNVCFKVPDEVQISHRDLLRDLVDLKEVFDRVPRREQW